MKLLNAWRIIFALLLALVTWLTLTPDPDDTKRGMAITRWISSVLFGGGVFADKIAHFLAYASLAASAVFAKLTIFGRPVFFIVALAFYGLALEGVQGLGGVREADLTDALCNAVGALCAYPAALLVDAAARRMAAS